jgi:acyl-CoA synthetase (AMP-forming)/AMP-acid ligase II
MKNWFDYILFHTRTQPEKPAMVMEDRVVTYAMLQAGIERCAHRIAALDIALNGPVAVLIRNPIRHLTLCFALFRLGIATISLEHAQSGIGRLKFAAVLGDDAENVVDPANRVIAITDDWFGTDRPGETKFSSGFSAAAQLCRASLTSGSTGAPKIVNHTVADVGRRIPPFIAINWNVALCMPGLSSNWGFTTACAVLATGRTLCFAESPFQAIRMIELFAIDFVMASTEQLLVLTRVARKSGAHLQSLRTIWIGGTVPSRALLEAAMIYLCRNILCRYAASEIGLMAQATAAEVLASPGLVGHIVPGVDIAIFDAHGGRCQPSELGMVKGRCHDETIGSASSQQAGDWIDLGDVGWMTPQGQLYIVGRASDGSMVGTQDPADLRSSLLQEAEHVLRLEWDATDAAAVFVDDATSSLRHIWIAIVGNKDVSAEGIAAALRARGIDYPIRLMRLKAVPRGANGKVSREQLKSLMLASTFGIERA